MIINRTPLEGVFLIDMKRIEDERGFFGRFFCENEFSSFGLNTYWPQINNSLSVEAFTLRGLHYQRSPHAEIKLVRCLTGSIWDVVVDIREHSATFGRWFSAKLTAENRTMMYVPRGFAHGFLTLTEHTEVLYLVSDRYTPSAEAVLAWNDHDVQIKWPVTPKIISQKDSNGHSLLSIGIKK